MGSGFGEGFTSDSFGQTSKGFGGGFFKPPATATIGSALFNGLNNFLRVAINSVFFPGTSDYTVEWWQRSQAGIPSNSRVFSIGVWDTANFALSVEGSAYGWHNGSLKNLGNYGSVNGVWTHFAMVRSSGTLKLYKNGSNISGVGVSANENITPDLAKFFVVGSETSNGTSADYNNSFKGNITGFHMVIGSALYTGDFAVPASAPVSVANTKLLLNFVDSGSLLNDSSTFGHAITNINNVTWDAASPF